MSSPGQTGDFTFPVPRPSSEASQPRTQARLMQNGATTPAPKPVTIPEPKLKPDIRPGKIPLEKGYSQMDWMRLTKTHPDLAGLKGRSRSRPITMAEVKQHRSRDDAWLVLKGKVYNVTPYLKFHPGGLDWIMKGAGLDATSLFNKYHAWVNAEFMLEKCMVGHLTASPPAAQAS